MNKGRTHRMGKEQDTVERGRALLIPSPCTHQALAWDFQARNCHCSVVWHLLQCPVRAWAQGGRQTWARSRSLELLTSLRQAGLGFYLPSLFLVSQGETAWPYARHTEFLVPFNPTIIIFLSQCCRGDTEVKLLAQDCTALKRQSQDSNLGCCP